MGKYMRKPKITCDVAPEVCPPIGVKTRAKTKTLALQNPTLDNSSSYIQLRSRRLQKVLPRQEEVDSGSVCSNSESSVGENYNLEFQCRERNTRESTPCNFIRESVAAETPSSTTKQTSSTANNRITEISISITQEIEEFFASAEKEQQMLFAEWYNFDVVNDVPLPGCYEWVRVEN